MPISTSLKGKGKKAGKTKGSGKSKTAKAKPAKSKNKSAKLTAASTPGGDKARVSDPLNSPQAMVVAAAAAAVTGVSSDSALAHPHLSMAMSGTANEPKGVPRGGFGSDGVTSMLAAANAAVTGQMAGYHPLGSSRNAQGLLSTGVLNPFSLPGPLGAPIPMYPGFNNGTHFGLSLVNDQASLSNSGLAEDGAGEGADFGSMLPDSFTPSSSAPPGAAKDPVAASNDAIAMSPQRRSKSAKQNGKKSNKRVRGADNSTDAVAQKTPVAGSGNPERTHPLKQRKLMGTTPGLSLSISARRGTSTSPLLKHTPLSPWVSQVKKLPAPSRTASVRFSADADVISGNKSQDGSLSTKRRFSYEPNAGTDKTASGIDGNKGLSRSGLSSKASPSAAASPSSTPVWSTAASRASENNAFLKHGSLRFNNGGGAGRAHRSLSSSSSSTTSSSLSSSSSSQVAVSWRRNYQSRQRTALHTAVASGNITTVRAILSKIASQGGVLHSPMPSPTKGEVHQQDVPSMRQENPVMHVNSAVVEAVNRPDKFGYTPLMVAVTLGFTGKTASSPRSRSSSSNSSPKVSQGSAATGTGSGVAAGSETSATSASEVHFSIGLMMCAILLNVEANPFLSDDAGMTAIHWASQAGDAQVLQFLLVRCSEKLTSSLLKPIATGEPLKEIVAIMDSAEASAKAFAEGWQARDASTRSSGDDSSAIARDKMPSLEQVLSVTCRAGDTALHIAARQANVECISVLFEAGASLLKRNYACETPYDVIAVSFFSQLLNID